MNSKFSEIQEKLKNKKILVIGTIFMDIKGYPEGVFIPMGRNKGHIEYQYGGVGRNVAADLAGLGGKPYFVSLSESEGHGKAILNDLEQRGVRIDGVQYDENGIGTWMAIMDEQGEVYANLSKRQNLTPLLKTLSEKEEELFREADGILLEMDVSEALVSRVFSLAEKYHIDVYGVISNMTVALERFPYIQKTRCFICNRQEAGMMFHGLNPITKGKESDRELDPETEQLIRMLETEDQGTDCDYETLADFLARGILTAGIHSMVVTMDKDGSVFADAKGGKGWLPAQAVTVADTTGAGDSFFSGAAAALICGSDLKTACELGTYMASQVIGSRDNTYRKK